MKNNIRICHVTSVHQRTDPRIGKFCTSLTEAGYEVVLLCVDQLADEQIGNLQIKSVKYKPKNKLHRILFSAKHLVDEALKIDADIYHVHDPELLPMITKLIKQGKKVIYDSHEDFPQQIKEKSFIPIGFKNFASLLAKYYLRKCLKKVDAVISVTPHIVEKLQKLNKNAYLITNYPKLPEKINEFDIDNFCHRKNQICYAGTVYKFSNQEFIIKALENVQQNITYKIVGFIDEKLKSSLAVLKGWEKVNYHNRVPKKELELIYSESTIGVIIYDYCNEVGGKIGTLGSNKIFEYMLEGLPIICTDFEVWKGFVNRYNCGICVAPHNEKAIQNAIEFLIENKEEAYQMGQNGKRAVLEEFNWNTQQQVYLELVKKIL